MESTSSRKKTDKRTKGLSNPQRKARRAEQKKVYHQSRVYIGAEQHQRWQSARRQLGVKSDIEMAKLLLDRFQRPASLLFGASTPIKHQTQEMVSVSTSFEISSASENVMQAKPVSTSAQVATSKPEASGEISDVGRISEETLPMESQSKQTDENDVTTYESRNDSVSASLVCQNHAEATSQGYTTTGDSSLFKSQLDSPDQENAESKPSIKVEGQKFSPWRSKGRKVVKEEVISNEQTEISKPKCRISGGTLHTECSGCTQTNESKVSGDESNYHPVVELVVIPCENDEDVTSQDERNGDDSVKSHSETPDQENADLNSSGSESGKESEEYGPEEDSDWESDSDGLAYNDNVKDDEDWVPNDEDCAPDDEDCVLETSMKEKEPKITAEKCKKREAKKEEAIIHEQTEVRRKKPRYKRRKQSWRDMEKTFDCQICTSQYTEVFHTCQHLLQTHSEVVGDLVSYLKERQASNSKPDITMYDVLSEILHPVINKQQGKPHDAEGEKELGSSEISAEERDFGTRTDGCEKMRYSFDDAKLVEFLLRWVTLKIRCQYCQREALRTGIFNMKSGKETIHLCRIVGDSGDEGIELYNSLCEVCGKSFSQEYLRRSHTKKVHSEERCPCHICGKMVKMSFLNSHIWKTHRDVQSMFPCGVCEKSFKTKKDREKHTRIHKAAKPFKCVYCSRSFTQLCNMKHHMRQHTGEKPYQCDKCKESFTHKVSLKNHLKKKHDIDLWKMGHTGGGRPKKQKSNINKT